MGEELVEAATVHASSVAELERGALTAILEKHSFLRITGLISPATVREAKQRLAAGFSMDDDRPSTGETLAELMSGIQKLSAGGVNPNQRVKVDGKTTKGVRRPRLMRTLYLPLSDDNPYGFDEIFRTACAVRNLLYGFEPGFCVEAPEGGYWTACRIHQYPAGGGFLIDHRDEAVPALQQQSDWPAYYQPLIVLSKPGEDFESGGAFAEAGGERIFYEQFCELGDIAVYDGRTVHGVADVDPNKLLRLDQLNGRMAGFVTLYKDLRQKTMS